MTNAMDEQRVRQIVRGAQSSRSMNFAKWLRVGGVVSESTLGKGKPAYQYGRFQLSIDAETGTTALLLENVYRADEHWLTLALRDAPHCPIGYMRLRPVSRRCFHDSQTKLLGPHP